MPGQHPAVERILSRAGGRDLHTFLEETLSASDLRSLLMSIFRGRVDRVTLPGLLDQLQRPAGVVAPSVVDGRVFHALEGLAWQALSEETTVVDLSPLLPLGASAALAGTPQDNVATTIRGAEVTGDPTLAMALIAASRRREDASSRVRLATSQRVLRMQRFSGPAHTAHFRLIALMTAGRDLGSERFETEALCEHIGFYLRFLEASAERGYRVRPLAVRLSDFALTRALCREAGIALEHARWHQAQRWLDERGALPPRALRDLDDLPAGVDDATRRRFEHLQARVIAPLSRRHPEVDFAFDLGRTRQATYYESFGFHVLVGDDPEGPMPLADGGFVNWSARLLSNRKERMLTSGIGLSLFAKLMAG